MSTGSSQVGAVLSSLLIHFLSIYFIVSLGSLRSSDVCRCESGRCCTLSIFLSFQLSRFSFYINIDLHFVSSTCSVTQHHLCSVYEWQIRVSTKSKCITCCVLDLLNVSITCLETSLLFVSKSYALLFLFLWNYYFLYIKEVSKEGNTP